MMSYTAFGVRKEDNMNIINNKIKAIHPHIIVKETYSRDLGKNINYYEIEYYDMSDNVWHEGFGSSCLSIVQKCLHEYFEVVKEDIAPVIHGSWREISQSEKVGSDAWMTGCDSAGIYICSNCLEEAIYGINEEFVLSAYCPHCGARMW